MRDSLSDIAADDAILDRLGGRLPVTSDEPVVQALAAWTTRLDDGAPSRRDRGWRRHGGVVPVLAALALTVGGSSVAAALTGADVPVLASVGREMVGWAPGGEAWLASSDSAGRAPAPDGDRPPTPDDATAALDDPTGWGPTAPVDAGPDGVEGLSGPSSGATPAGVGDSSVVDSWAGSGRAGAAGRPDDLPPMREPGGRADDRVGRPEAGGGTAAPGSPAGPADDGRRDTPGRPAEPGPPTEVGPPAGLGRPADAGRPPERRPDHPQPTGPGREDPVGRPSDRPTSLVGPPSPAASATQGPGPGVRTGPGRPVPPSASERAADPTRTDPSRPTDAGRPTDQGRPEDPGRPTDAGRPTDQGRPEGPGRPEDPGRPTDAGRPTG